MATLTAAPAVGAATAVTGSSYATNAKVTDSVGAVLATASNLSV